MSGQPTISLRARAAEDVDVLYLVSSDQNTWEERNPEGAVPITRGQFEARIARLDEAESSGDSVSFVIDADGVAVGSASLFDFDQLARHAEVGIALLPEARGRGIGTAAIRQLVEFGFVRRNLRRLHLQAIASNASAIRAYEKAGFVEEGRQRQHAWVRGRYEDIIRMGILRDEHPAAESG